MSLSRQLTLRASYGTISIAVFLEEVLSQNSSLVEWLQKDGIINSFILGLGNAAEGKVSLMGNERTLG